MLVSPIEKKNLGIYREASGVAVSKWGSRGREPCSQRFNKQKWPSLTVKIRSKEVKNWLVLIPFPSETGSYCIVHASLTLASPSASRVLRFQMCVPCLAPPPSKRKRCYYLTELSQEVKLRVPVCSLSWNETRKAHVPSKIPVQYSQRASCWAEMTHFDKACFNHHIRKRFLL